jgi:hypothetical protein
MAAALQRESLFLRRAAASWHVDLAPDSKRFAVESVPKWALLYLPQSADFQRSKCIAHAVPKITWF